MCDGECIIITFYPRKTNGAEKKVYRFATDRRRTGVPRQALREVVEILIKGFLVHCVPYLCKN